MFYRVSFFSYDANCSYHHDISAILPLLTVENREPNTS
jgi:hypothetical protein